MDIAFQLIWVGSKDRDCSSFREEYVSFWGKPANRLPQWLPRFAFPPAFGGVRDRDSGRSDRHVRGILG